MKYTVMNAYDLTTLIEKVNDLIKEGWKPLGGIQAMIDNEAQDPYRYNYCQAMIKKTE